MSCFLCAFSYRSFRAHLSKLYRRIGGKNPNGLIVVMFFEYFTKKQNAFKFKWTKRNVLSHNIYVGMDK